MNKILLIISLATLISPGTAHAGCNAYLECKNSHTSDKVKCPSSFMVFANDCPATKDKIYCKSISKYIGWCKKRDEGTTITQEQGNKACYGALNGKCPADEKDVKMTDSGCTGNESSRISKNCSVN